MDENKAHGLTADHLRALLSYDPATGTFTWRVSTSNQVREGAVAGGRNSDGYILIKINKRNRAAHRLAWLYMTGEWPTAQVDHRNGERADNRWENLRAATRSQNLCNQRRRSDNASGVTGVSWHKGRQKWQAYVKLAGSRKHLGLFDDLTAGASVARAARQRLHGEFARAA